MRVLTFAASYDDGGLLVVDPGFVTDGDPTPDADKSDPAIDVEVLDRKGATLHAARVGWTPLCAPAADGSGGGSPAVALGAIPFGRAAAGLRVTDGVRVVVERMAPRTPLTAEVRWPEPVRSSDDRKRLIDWKSEEGALAIAAYSPDGGTSWLPLGIPSATSPLEVDLTNVPGSDKGQLRLLVTDGLRTITVDSSPWPLVATGWVGAILTPADGTRIEAGIPVVLAGQAIELERREWADAQLEWHTEGLGRLGSGAELTVAFPPGSHIIQLRIGDRVLAAVVLTVGD